MRTYTFKFNEVDVKVEFCDTIYYSAKSADGKEWVVSYNPYNGYEEYEIKNNQYIHSDVPEPYESAICIAMNTLTTEHEYNPTRKLQESESNGKFKVVIRGEYDYHNNATVAVYVQDEYEIVISENGKEYNSTRYLNRKKWKIYDRFIILDITTVMEKAIEEFNRRVS